MQHETLSIKIDGSEDEALYNDLLRLEVELDEELAGMFHLTISLLLQADGSWTHLDDGQLAIWKRVVISAGFEDDSQTLITGYITHLRPVFEAAPEQCQLEVWGMDASVLMDREDKLKDWPDKKDSDIAQEIFSSYGLSAQVADTELIHDEQVSTIIQRETDIQFLKRLALRNGYECFVENETGYFRPPEVDATAQPVLAAYFGDETNLNRFELEVNALAPADVAMFQIDHTSKEVLDASSAAGQQKALGAKSASSFVVGGTSPGLVVIGKTVATGSPEMTALTQGLYNQGEWFVTGEGEVAANHYGSILKPHGTVTIKGIGETHSGIYYVTHVSHIFSGDGYTQHFKVKRNGLELTGAEDFSAGGAGLLGSLL